MGKRGPPPTPTATLAMRGSDLAPGRQKTEPVPEAGYPRMPAGLDPDCTVEWRRLREELEPLGVASRGHGSALERIVWLRVDCRALRAKIGDLDDYTYQCGAARQQHPEWALWRGLMADLAKLEQQFGMTPATQSNVVVDKGGGGSKLPTRRSA